jgi:6-phosphogluconate dehydrogenase
MEMAIIGLGKMGNELAQHALKEGIRVIGLTNQPVSQDTKELGLIEAKDLEELIQNLKRPRKIFLYVPSGSVVEHYVEVCMEVLSEGDIVIDGGNSYWGDSVRRHKSLSKKGIKFLDMGTSGGISGAREGACFMVGGEREAYEQVAPILEHLATPGAQVYVGPSGSGHLVKLIHNGIEFGMLQAIGEGMALLERYREDLPIDMEATFQAYRHGSVIRSWLIDLMHEQYQSQQGMGKIPSYVEDTGEVNWLVNDALQLEVPIPVISQSIMELLRSRDGQRNDYKAVALMRHGFGGHPLGARPEFKFGRLGSRVGQDFPWSYLKEQHGEQ